MPVHDSSDQKVGSVALVMLRATLLLCAVAMVGTLASVAWKIATN
jgi:hypothetical protein